MSDYYVAVNENGQPYIVHAFWNRKGKEKKDHKYIEKIKVGNKFRYFYTKEELQAYLKQKKTEVKEKVRDVAGVDERARRDSAKKAYDVAKQNTDYSQERLSEASEKPQESTGQKKIVENLKRAVKRDQTREEEKRDAFTKALSDYYKTPLGMLEKVSDKVDEIKSKREASSEFKRLAKKLKRSNVDYNPIAESRTKRKEETIISELGGGDMTAGSCSSLAMAYIGNKAGYEVLDFRGGKSLEIFSNISNMKDVAHLDGVESKVKENISGTSPMEDAYQLLESVEEGKEYYFAAGSHAAVVRRQDGQLQYLELQSGYDDGWKELDVVALGWRFMIPGRAFASFSARPGTKTGYTSFLIDAQSLASSKEFISLLGYINTDKEAQKKGASGHIR